MFGLCKTDCYVGRFLSHPFIAGLGSLSYGIYILHPPIIMWARKVYYAEMKDWHDVFSYDYYAEGKCVQRTSPVNCEMYPFAHVTVFTLVLCCAHALNELVHRPCQRILNRAFNARRSSPSDYDRIVRD